MGEVLIVVLNWNGQEYIEDCLESIINNTKHRPFEICVVDNGSDDRSVNKVRNNFGDVEVIENSRNLGFAIGNNKGIYRNREHSYFALLNSDTRVKKRWLKEMVDVLEQKEKAGVCGSKILNDDGTIQSAGVDTEKLESLTKDRIRDDKRYKKVGGVLGASFVMSADLVKQIGYLDEVYSPMQHEESDYCCRAREAGYSIYLSYESEVVHYGGRAKENVKSSFERFCELKNTLKYRIMNDTFRSVLSVLCVHTKFVLLSILEEEKEYPTKVYFWALAEVFVDLPDLIAKKYNRDGFVPSYYCEDKYDYSQRYT